MFNVGKHNKRGHIFTDYGGNDVPEFLLQELITGAIKVHKILESLANPKISFGFEVVFHFEKIEVVFHLKKVQVVFHF